MGKWVDGWVAGWVDLPLLSSSFFFFFTMGGWVRGTYLRLLEVHLSSGSPQVRLVPCQGNDHGRVAPALEFLHPRLGPLEALRVGDVVHDNGRAGPAVVPLCFNRWVV